jgi:hypothetical protein
MAFDYDNTEGPDDIETIRSIAADMANAGKPPPMSDTEREEWQAWREQQEWLAEHQRRESQRRRAEAEKPSLPRNAKRRPWSGLNGLGFYSNRCASKAPAKCGTVS